MALNWTDRHNGVDIVDAKDVNILAAAIIDSEAEITYNRIDLAQKVDKENGKCLSTNDYTTDEKNKLIGIEPGAEVNVQADWSVTNSGSDAYIKNKPDVYTKKQIDDKIAKIDVDAGVLNDVNKIKNNETKIKNASNGFSAGLDSGAGYGGAVGSGAVTDNGGSVGSHAATDSGGAVGSYANAGNGGSVGGGAVTSNGFAGGENAKTVKDDEPIDAIQLGTGTNSNEKTLQVYKYQLMDAEGKVPTDRLPSIPKTATLVIGSSKSGYSANKVDYLCSGTNDQTTIQNAINALPSNGGKIVLLEGTYNIGGTINVNKGGVTIEGMGRDATVLQTSGSITIFSIISLDCKISDMTIKQSNGSRPSGCGGIIISAQGWRTTVRDVDISGFSYGISVGGLYNIIDSLYADDNAYGIYLGGNGQKATISNCLFMNNDYGVGVESSHSNIFGNYFHDNDKAGIWLVNYGTPNYNKIHGNYITSGDGSPDDYTPSQYTILVQSPAKYNDFSNNYILGKNYVNSGGSTNTFNNNRY